MQFHLLNVQVFPFLLPFQVDVHHMTGPSVAAAPRSKACQGVLDITPLTKHRRREQCAEKRSSGAEEPSRRPVPLWKARDILLEAAQGGEMLKHIQQEQCWSSSPRGRSGESGGKSGAERGAGLGSVLRSGGDGGDAVRIFSLRLEVRVLAYLSVLLQ